MEGVVTKIQKAKTKNEIRAIINYANWTKPNGAMRRRFLAAAAARIKELDEQQQRV